MVMQKSSHPHYVEFALPYASDFMTQGNSCNLMPATKNQTKCSTLHQHHLDGCGELFPETKKRDDDLSSLNNTRNYSELSTSSTMSENFTPTIVYQRRRHRKNSVAFFTIQSFPGTKPSDVCNSTISSEAPSMAAQDNMVSVSDCAAAKKAVRSPIEEADSEEALITDVDRVLSVNDNCSSSRSNLELSSNSLKISNLELSSNSLKISNLELSSNSLKMDVDDAGECSSSGALVADVASPGELSERDICISILRSQGLLDKVYSRKDRGFTENCNANYCSKSCTVCENMESTKNMLICDNCEDAFHVSCYNPHITVLPVGEWLCGSCLKRKHKILKDKCTSNPANISSESVRNRSSASVGELGSLEFMFTDTEPYMSNVRIGDEFQASVPDWHGRPIDKECDLVGDPLDTDPCNNVNMQELDSFKPLKRTPIGNWLQCREGVGDDEGTICGKWRRAPLFEVQTDGWECFCCVLWDPAHADCAVPQELDTEEIMKQLKYIEMLRPRLAAKRRKLDC